MFKVDEETFYTLQDLSDGLHITITGLRVWIRQGKLKAAKIGRHYWVYGKDLAAFLHAGDGTKEKS